MRHILGITLLQEWLQRWQGQRGEVKYAGQAIALGPGASARFALALPARRGMRAAPALVAQDEELPWLTRIAWRQACIRQGGAQRPELCLLAARIEQDDALGLPCLPAFALSLSLGDHLASLQLASFASLDVRPVLRDVDAGTWRVGAGRPIQSLQLSPWPEQATTAEDLLSPADVSPGTSVEDMLRRRLAQTETTRNPFLARSATAGSHVGRQGDLG